jgi:hypothetical protein
MWAFELVEKVIEIDCRSQLELKMNLKNIQLISRIFLSYGNLRIEIDKPSTWVGYYS